MTKLSVLDLSPIIQGGDATLALRNTLDLARHAEKLGFNRYWLAEHHNMPGIASAATAVVIAHVAGGTSTIKVGSGGIMLPNHSPLVIAEQFGTLAALHPGRIELGLGRAPGTDMRTARALRRNLAQEVDTFPQDVIELHSYFQPAVPGQAVRAVPGAGLKVPMWLLGSSLYSAQLAAHLGLPFAFASHFAPGMLMQALDIYREAFRPSEELDKPYSMAGFNVFAADEESEAHRIFTSAQQQFVNLRRGVPGPLPPPLATMDGHWAPHEKAMVEDALACRAVGTPDQVHAGIDEFARATGVDELMITGQIFDHEARKRSFAIAAGAMAPVLA